MPISPPPDNAAAVSAAAGPGLPAPSHDAREYFHRLRRRLRIGLATAFLLPLIILSLYFHYQFTGTLAEIDNLHLSALAESQRNTVDLFLQERVVNLFNLFRHSQFSRTPTPDQMRRYLERLRQITDAFVDVGFFDGAGVQVGYHGPFPDLLGKDYGREPWFRTVVEQADGHHITDIYLGFRNRPHFTIAVKQRIDDEPVVIRATLEPGRVYEFLRSISHEKGIDSALVNREGRYQVVDPDRGRPLTRTDFLPPREPASGTAELPGDPEQERSLAAYAWLQSAPWALIVRQRHATAYANMYRARRIIMVSTAVLVVAILVTIWLTTGWVVRRAEKTEESRADLQFQLVHAARLASAGELAAGVAHEINNPLAIISAESGLIRDMLDPQFGLDSSPEKIREQLDHIDSAVGRAKTITQKLLSLVRHSEPNLVPCNVNDVLDEVLSGLKEKEFQVADIRVVRHFDGAIPEVMVDANKIRQVFLNILNNAGDAIEGPGAITLTTGHDGRAVRVSITDTGKGMTPDQLQRIFVPFFTTKDTGKGTGLGLSISLQIIESLGGRIEVQSAVGRGSSFTIVLPRKQGEDLSHGD